MTPLEALRAIGCTDEEIRARAEWLDAPAEEMDEWADEEASSHRAAIYRLNAAILRAAEQLGPERTPVTRETPLGEGVAHPDDGNLGPCRWLVGWTLRGRMVTEDLNGVLERWDADDGWYVVEGDR